MVKDEPHSFFFFAEDIDFVLPPCCNHGCLARASHSAKGLRTSAAQRYLLLGLLLTWPQLPILADGSWRTALAGLRR